LKITGKFVKSIGQGQAIEVLCEDPENHEVEVCGECDPKFYPISKKYHKAETLREHCHLRPRTNLIGGVARVRNALAFATHLFYQSRGYLYVHTPLITASDCEGAGEMF
jgi:asparaginyl-tRNA synthetase